MLILAKLVFKSYMPKQLEIGMWFKKHHADVVYGKIYNYITIYELKELPPNMDEYISINGAPIEPYIIQPMRNADDPEEILVTPDFIGWWEYEGGTEVDDDGNWIPNIILEDLSPGYINGWIYGENGDNDGLIALEVDDETREPLLYEGKVVIKQADYVDEVEEDEEDEEDDYEDMDWEDDEPEEDSAGYTIDDRCPKHDADHETQ